MKRFFSLLLLLGSLLLTSCFDSNSTSTGMNGDFGDAKLNISTGRVGSLAKLADINLAELQIELSSPGQITIFDTLPLSGNAQSNNQAIYTGLASLVPWTATVQSVDDNGVVIHAGSVNFVVPPGANVNVSLTLDAVYAMLKSYFFPIRDSVTQVELEVDGGVIEDSSFAVQANVGDTILLENDYLTTGVNHSITLRANGIMWGFPYTLYQGDTTLNIPAGVDTTINMTLYWVGPDLPPEGQATIEVVLGAVGTAVINGELEDTSAGSGALYYGGSNGGIGFFGYDVATDTWSTLPSAPAPSFTQLATDGNLVFSMGNDNAIHAYDPVLSTWSTVQSGPGATTSSPIAFFKSTPAGFYYVNDGETTLYFSATGSGTWTTFTLPVTASSAGTYDPATNRLYVRGYNNMDLIVWDVATNTLVSHFPNATSVGENSRTGSYYAGNFYVRESSGQFMAIDVATGVATTTGVTPVENHTSSTVDLGNGLIYVGPYSPTRVNFEVYDVAAGTINPIAPAPAGASALNHSTIVFVP